MKFIRKYWNRLGASELDTERTMRSWSGLLFSRYALG